MKKRAKLTVDLTHPLLLWSRRLANYPPALVMSLQYPKLWMKRRHYSLEQVLSPLEREERYQSPNVEELPPPDPMGMRRLLKPC